MGREAGGRSVEYNGLGAGTNVWQKGRVEELRKG